MPSHILILFFFFFNDTATTEIYTLSLHDALPIYTSRSACSATSTARSRSGSRAARSYASQASRPTSPRTASATRSRSEEHTSELQSRQYLVCRLLLEKKKKINSKSIY